MSTSIKAYSYKAICEKTALTEKRRVMFFATAVDIAQWSGIPQKMVIEGEIGAETIGFQRVENPSRVEEIKRFYSEPRNISNNPILCAVKSPSDDFVKFITSDFSVENNIITNFGHLQISLDDLHSYTFAKLFGMLRASLDARISSITENPDPTAQEISDFKKSLYQNSDDADDADDSVDDNTEADISSNDVATIDSDEMPTVESHILQFRKAIAIRELLCIEGAAEDVDEFAGFTKERLTSFLLPIVLVDGQHRVRGALESARAFLATEEYSKKQNDIYNELSLLYSGQDLESKVTSATLDLLRSVSPIIPVSLLLDADAAEQVFQFVVVNQKAVPIGKALLGTIVSTTLSEEELEQVRERLNNAGIPLENSRAITKLVVSPTSPFFNKVDRGLKKQSEATLLQWNVLSGLVQIVRNLRGARLYHEERGPDFANYWKEAFLSDSDVVKDYAALGYESPFKYWSSENGPWEPFFVSFFTQVKQRMANETSEEAHNYWGRPRNSNIFNKVYLNILLADFFEFMYSKEQRIGSIEEIPQLVDTWLAGASKDYFAKPWGLEDQKKDSTAIKKKWSTLWYNYRRSPATMKRIPQSRQFT